MGYKSALKTFFDETIRVAGDVKVSGQYLDNTNIGLGVARLLSFLPSGRFELSEAHHNPNWIIEDLVPANLVTKIEVPEGVNYTIDKELYMVTQAASFASYK